MEATPEAKPKTPKTKSTMKKLDPMAIKILASLKDRANKKDFGRKVREKDILTIALKQVTDLHLKELQEATLSDQDRLKRRHEDYCKANSRISLDEYIGRIMRGEISTLQNQKSSQSEKEV